MKLFHKVEWYRVGHRTSFVSSDSKQSRDEGFFFTLKGNFINMVKMEEKTHEEL